MHGKGRVTTTSTAGKTVGIVTAHDNPLLSTFSSTMGKHESSHQFCDHAIAGSAEEYAIMEIDTAIQKDGGSMGGWLECDHNAFQRVWTSIFGIHHEITMDGTTTRFGEEVQFQEMVARRLAIVLPEMDELEIRKHIRWYLVYCQRYAKRKKIVQSWRMTRDVNVHEEEKKLQEEEDKRRETDKTKEKGKAYRIQESMK